MRLLFAFAFCLCPTLAAANPETDPARYVRTDSLSVDSSAAESLARHLLGPNIAEAEAGVGRPITVQADLVTFQDGRRMLAASLCDAIWFGRTGCSSDIFIADPGSERFVAALAGLIGGGPFWLDLQLGAGGWPDIVVAPASINDGYVTFRWNGQQFVGLGY
ncbi:hypothetical protein RNZ50_19845 [Paracoccaceae bacterium Fryx2]|nr:hypothetical protein [Paracoccaceae bacterium Fryx2]